MSAIPDFECKVASLICIYSIEVCERAIVKPSEHYAVYYEGMIVCLRFHTEQSLRSLDESVCCLQQERSPVSGASLGGNPLRDCVLAVAMLVKGAKAVTVFEKDYFGYLKGIAFRAHPVFGSTPDEWWNEFLDFLAGYSHSNGKLKRYQGKSGLRPWLRIVCWNFLRRRFIPTGISDTVDETSTLDSDMIKFESNDTVSIFSKLVKGALLAIPKEDRLLLSLIYIDKLPKKDIALIFNVHPGQIGRRETKAIERLREELATRLEDLPHKDLSDEILCGSEENPTAFTETLIESLMMMRIIDTENITS